MPYKIEYVIKSLLIVEKSNNRKKLLFKLQRSRNEKVEMSFVIKFNRMEFFWAPKQLEPILQVKSALPNFDIFGCIFSAHFRATHFTSYLLFFGEHIYIKLNESLKYYLKIYFF